MERVIRVRIEQRAASAKDAPVVQIHEFLIPRTMRADDIAVIVNVEQMEIEDGGNLLLGANSIKETNEEWIYE